MTEVRKPGAYYGANVEGADRAASGGDDRPSGSPRRMESTMNIPNARQVPVEGAVTGAEALPINMDELYQQASLEVIDDLQG